MVIRCQLLTSNWLLQCAVVQAKQLGASISSESTTIESCSRILSLSHTYEEIYLAPRKQLRDWWKFTKSAEALLMAGNAQQENSPLKPTHLN